MSPLMGEVERAVARVEQASVLDPLSGLLGIGVGQAIPPGRIRETLRGAQLGHPLHPLVTDIPIGFLTTASVLDLVGPRTATSSQRFVGLGLLSALPTIAAGLADWSALRTDRQRRVGVVHAGANVLGLAFYLSSYRARRRNRWFKGAAMSVVGMTTMTAGGYLGGHLIFRQAANVEVPAPRELSYDPLLDSADAGPMLTVTIDDELRVSDK